MYLALARSSHALDASSASCVPIHGLNQKQVVYRLTDIVRVDRAFRFRSIGEFLQSAYAHKYTRRIRQRKVPSFF
jgi:hypothetical protein